MLQIHIVTGDGYTRSEAIVAVYIQKATTAKRVYGTIIHSKNNSDGNKNEGKFNYLRY